MVGSRNERHRILILSSSAKYLVSPSNIWSEARANHGTTRRPPRAVHPNVRNNEQEAIASRKKNHCMHAIFRSAARDRSIDRCFYVPVLLSLPSSSWSPRKRGRVARRSSNSMAPPRIAPTMNRSLCSSLSLDLHVSLSICTHAQAALWLLLARWLRSTHRCVTMAGAAAKESAERGVRWWVSRLERE